MVHRIGLLIASVAATAALTVALAAAGFAPGAPAKTPAVTAVEPVAAPAVDPTAQPQIVYDNVYVKPAPPQKTIVVKVTKPGGGEHEGGETENEGVDG